jgi:SAM-dependent methyltransferase
LNKLWPADLAVISWMSPPAAADFSRAAGMSLRRDRITGVDSGDRRRWQPPARPSPAQHSLRADGCRPPGFPDASFDTVSIANSLHHLADLPQALAEMCRVLKPGGLFIISEMYCDGQSEAQQTHVELHHWWAAVDTAQGITHYETFPRQRIVEIAEGLGLARWTYHDIAYLEDDPHAAELLAELEPVIDRYIERAAGLLAETELRQRAKRCASACTRPAFTAPPPCWRWAKK